MEELIDTISAPIIDVLSSVIRFAVGYLLVGVTMFIGGNIAYFTARAFGVSKGKMNGYIKDFAEWRIIVLGPAALAMLSPIVLIPLAILLFLYTILK